MNINLNTQVRVVLTDYGLNHLRGYYAGLNSVLPANKTEQFTLWELMQIFGPCLYMGNTEIPFEKNAIDLIEVEP